jgi:hypothetical protein
MCERFIHGLNELDRCVSGGDSGSKILIWDARTLA